MTFKIRIGNISKVPDNNIRICNRRLHIYFFIIPCNWMDFYWGLGIFPSFILTTSSNSDLSTPYNKRDLHLYIGIRILPVFLGVFAVLDREFRAPVKAPETHDAFFLDPDRAPALHLNCLHGAFLCAQPAPDAVHNGMYLLPRGLCQAGRDIFAVSCGREI